MLAMLLVFTAGAAAMAQGGPSFDCAKADNAIDVLSFPKRSPDLNPLDYGFWDCVNRRLRKQEAAFPSAKKETRAKFVARLKRTIQRVPEAVLTPLVKSMGRRCKALKLAKGHDFEE